MNTIHLRYFINVRLRSIHLEKSNKHLKEKSTNFEKVLIDSRESINIQKLNSDLKEK